MDKYIGCECECAEQIVAEKFREALKELGTDFKLIQNATIPLNSGKIAIADIIILNGEVPIAIVEVKRSLRNCDLQNAKKQVRHTASILYAPLGIICSIEGITLLDDNEVINLNVCNIVKILKSANYKIEQKKETVTEVSIDEIKKEWGKIIDGTPDFDTKEDVKEFFDHIQQDNIENVDINTFNMDGYSEDCFFEKLLGKYENDKLCRFTTINSIFRTCEEQRQSMCSIVCMNDKSEINYTTNKICLDQPLDFDEINGCYILSCCDISRKDDFNMWRLYANDAKGVCVEYKVNDLPKHFFLAPVSYAKDSEQNHPELELIKNMQGIKCGNRSFSFKKLAIWKHFFKPYDYKEEREIRLLFYNKCQKQETKDHSMANQDIPFKRTWIYEQDFHIITPIVSFSIEHGSKFPLIINEIRLGAKLDEVKINASQLEYLIKIKDMEPSGIKIINQSNFSHYR